MQKLCTLRGEKERNHKEHKETHKVHKSQSVQIGLICVIRVQFFLRFAKIF
jgi:hypothetical protein